ncbi:MAG: hypothetical protein L0Z62_51290 [Gemmataceae bacterium]|nr:hypothetical protein [Gemmataceae bacterium]
MSTRYCQLCKCEIPAERLEVMPETHLCVQCSARVGGEFELVAVRKNLGKQGSLKKGSEEVSVVKRRKRLPTE